MKDFILFKGKRFQVDTPKEGVLKVSEGIHSEQFVITFFILVFFFVAQMGALPYIEKKGIALWSSWTFWVSLALAICGLVYLWKKGCVLFDNVKQQVIIKRYQYKFLPPKIIAYSEISRLFLQANDVETEDGHVFTKYFFKLLLKTGKKHPMFKVVGDKQSRYMRIQLKTHLPFKWKETHHGVPRRPPLFKR